VSGSPPTSVLARELALEQAHVDRVYASLGEAIASARTIEAESQVRYRADRADWLREEDGTALFERDAFAYQAARRLALLDAEHEGLVFGRLDLAGPEARYIGRIGVRDTDYEPLVIDWRAPAAESFYRATAVNPMDVIRRRVLRCQGETVVGIEDDLLDQEAGADMAVIGDGALMAALGRSRGPQMRDIVATIQAEQDEAIRAPYQGVTLIAGGPGTGKTVVALHRAAYLLYTYRRRLENGGVLMVGPSTLFMRYIERVLPGLGEDTVQLRSIGQVAADVLGFGSDLDEAADAAAIKGSLVMLPVLRRLVALPLLEPEAAQVLRVGANGEVLSLGARELAAVRSRVLGQPRAKANNLAPAVAALLDALWAKLPHQEATPRDAFEDAVTAQASWQMFLHAWWPALTPEQVLARLGSPRVLAQVAAGLLSPAQQAVLSGSLAHASGFAPQAGRPAPAWTIPDIALLDELANLLGPTAEEAGPDVVVEGGEDVAEVVTLADLLTDRRELPEPGADEPLVFAHVLVDESQDVTPMQWRMLRRRGPQASWTLVGDPAQSSYPIPEETNEAVRDLIGRSPTRTFHLSTNYRSPAEVFDLASAYIARIDPRADLPRAVRETGVRPELLSVTPEDLLPTLETCLEGMLGAVEGTIALIAPPTLHQRLRERADELPGLAEHADRVSLITALQAKGMEFDGVILVSPDDIVRETPGGGRVLYVDLTRPTQRLVAIDLTAPRPGAWRTGLAGYVPEVDAAAPAPMLQG